MQLICSGCCMHEKYFCATFFFFVKQISSISVFSIVSLLLLRSFMKILLSGRCTMLPNAQPCRTVFLFSSVLRKFDLIFILPLARLLETSRSREFRGFLRASLICRKNAINLTKWSLERRCLNPVTT